MAYVFLKRRQKQRLWKLRNNGVPGVMLELVALCFLAGYIDDNLTFNVVEFFAGINASSATLTRNWHTTINKI